MSELKTKTIHGLFWSFIELISKQGIQLAIQILLARLLLPEHFGLIGMITIFIAISTTFVQSGLDQALIRELNPENKEYSTVFYFNLLASIVIYGVVFLLAPLIAQFFNEPELVAVLRVLMIVVIINAFSVIQRVILIRNVDFKTQTKISVIAGIISGIVAVGLAIMGLGVWSLVFQQITMQLFNAILLFISNRWIPTLEFSMTLFRKHFNFGSKLLVSSLIDTIYKNIYFVIIGKLYPSVQLGYYTNASKFRDVSSQSMTQAIQKVTYPILSGIQNDSLRLSANYKQLLKMTSYLFFPVMLGVSAIAPNLIPFMLGDKWIPSVEYFQLLCIAGMLYPIHAINLNILKVKNRSDLFLLLEIIKKFILTILITIAVFSGLGIKGLIYAAITNSFISLFVNTYYSAREIGYSFVSQMKDMAPAFLISWIMFITVYFSDKIINVPIIFTLIIQVSMGIIIYGLLSYLFKLEEFVGIKKIIVNIKNQ